MKNRLFIVIGLMLFCLFGPMAIRPKPVLRPVLDEKGQQVYREDGKPKREPDPLGEFKLNWDAYSIMSIGGICILYGVGSGLQNLIRNRQRRSSGGNA